MTETPPDLISTSTKQIMALHSRKSEILREIEEIEQAAISGRVESNYIHNLKEEYNLLVDGEEEIRLKRSADPLEVLPPELWPNILPGTARERLVLSLVCDSWRNAVLSVPTMWSWVELDGRREDYLAQTIACFAFSAPLKISLTICLPLVTWKEVLPLIVAERTRISFLNIRPFDEIKPNEALEMISDLGDLPSLTFVNVPGFYDEPALLVPYMGVDDRSRNINPDFDALFKQAPSLSAVLGLVFTTEQLQITGIMKLTSIYIHSFHRKVVELLSHLPKLTSLRLVEDKDPYGANKSLPKFLDSSLASITTFYYHGLTLSRALRCIGPNLETLDAKYVTMRQLPDILASLQLFPRLYHLTLCIDLTNAEEFANLSADAISLPSVTSLNLSFTTCVIRRWDDNFSEDEGRLEEGRRDQARKNLFEYLVFVMPHVEEFNLYGKGYHGAAAAYIQSLKKLRSLYFSSDTTELDRPQLSLTSEQLESVSWVGDVPVGGVFNVVRSTTLRKLDLLPETSSYSDHDNSITSGGRIPSLRSRVPSIFTNLRALSITVEQPLPWDLRLFPRLETIELSGHPTALRAGDFFEELLLQPASCPFLEEVGIRGHYVEWDLLILLLERRNFITTPGIARIKTIQVKNDISYKLLRPISELLRGRYTHRDSIEEFSSTAIGRLLWDPLVPGCEKCLRAFRGCPLPSKPVVAPGYEEYELSRISSGDKRFGEDYPLLLEPLSADPPLHLDAAQWLASKKERRRRFAEGCKKARVVFHRSTTCGSKWGFDPLIPITSHSLNGAYFKDEADQ